MSKIIIESGQAEKNYWKDLYRYRELFFMLAWRDVAVRYKQTVFGVAWAVIRPFLTMVVFTIVFGKIAKLPSEGDAPYAIMVYAGLLPWQFFSYSLNEASNSIISNSSLISKVYFPRMIIPASSVITSFVDFMISGIILVFIMAWYHFIPSWRILILPVFIGVAFVVSMGAGLLLTALNVKYRDFRYIVPFIIQFGLYISPVGFSSGIIPDKYMILYSLNPMVSVIDGFRWAILGGASRIYLPGFALSFSFAISVMIVGVFYFRKTEKNFADII